MTQESTIEAYLVKRINALGGIALKGAVPGRRFIDRICVLSDGVTLWVECKKPKGGRRTAHQEKTIETLLDLGHFAFFVKTKAEIDHVIDGTRVFTSDGHLTVGLFAADHSLAVLVSTPKGLMPLDVS